MPEDIVKLIRSIQAGDDTKWNELSQKLYPLVSSYSRKTSHINEYEDVAQKAMIIILQKLHGLRQPERYSGWIRMIVATARRRSSRRITTLESDVVHNHRYEQYDDIEVIRKAIDRLKPSDKEMIQRCDLDGENQKSYALRLDVPEITVRRRLFYARQRLRNLVEELIA